MAHILLIGSYAPSLLNFRGKMLEEMVRRGHKVGATAPDATEEIKTGLAGIGVTYYDISLQRRGLNPVKDVAYLWRLYRLFRRIKPDLVLGYTIKPVVYGSLAARLAGVDCIASMITGLGYTFVSNTPRARLLKALAVFLYRISIRHNRVVFFQNHDDLQVFADNNILSGNTRPVVIPGSGVDVDHYVPVALPKQEAFLMIARLVREKGVLDYMEAARLLKVDYPEVCFRLLGHKGKGTSYISEQELTQACEAGIVEYLGTIKDVRPAIADCSVYVLPTHGGEGTPRTVLEAMAMGRAVITTDTPGCREAIIDGVNGLLVPPRDVSALMAAMKRLLDARQERNKMAAANRDKAVRIYSVDKVNAMITQSLGL